MQWSQIKTLFIVCFLILNVYLLYQFVDKKKSSDLRVKEQPDSSIQASLENENITVGDLPDEDMYESFITASQHRFTKDEFKKIDHTVKQEMKIVDDTLLISRFEKALPIPKDAKAIDFENVIEDHVLQAENYDFWAWNKDVNVLIFFQKKNDRPVYYNQNGLLLVYLNDKNEMEFYTQMILDKEEEQQSDEQEIIKPMKAVETLYKGNELDSGDEITKANLGFYTRMPVTYGVQVFVPTWKITVNEDENFFVNALEGFTFPSDDGDFLKTVLNASNDKLKELDEHDGLTDFIFAQLESRLLNIELEETK